MPQSPEPRASIRSSKYGLRFSLGFRAQGLRFRGLGFRVQGLRFRGLGFRVLGFKVQGLGFRAESLGLGD